MAKLPWPIMASAKRKESLSQSPSLTRTSQLRYCFCMNNSGAKRKTAFSILHPPSSILQDLLPIHLHSAGRLGYFLLFKIIPFVGAVMWLCPIRASGMRTPGGYGGLRPWNHKVISWFGVPSTAIHAALRSRRFSTNDLFDAPRDFSGYHLQSSSILTTLPWWRGLRSGVLNISVVTSSQPKLNDKKYSTPDQYDGWTRRSNGITVGSEQKVRSKSIP